MNTSTPLTANSQWISSVIDLMTPQYSNIKRINMIVKCDVACTMYIYQSVDNTTWTTLASESVTANISANLNKQLSNRYVRVSIINGPKDMAYLNVIIQVFKHVDVNEVYLFDSSGNSITTTNNSLNANITNNSFTVSDSTVATNTSAIATNTNGISSNISTIATRCTSIATNTTGLNNCINTSNQLKVNDYDVFNNRAQNDNFGNRRITETNKLVGEQFESSLLDNNYWSSYTLNNGSNTVFDSELWMVSGTGTSNSQAIVSTINKARYIGQHANIFRSIVFTGDAGYVNCTRRWGCSNVQAGNNITNGCYFQFTGSTLSAVYISNNSATTYNLPAITMTAPHVYEIHYTNNYLNYVIDGASVYVVNTNNIQWSQTIHLYGFISNICSDNSNAGYVLVCRSLNISRLGPLHGQNDSYFISGSVTDTVLKYSCGLINSITICNISNNSNISLYDGISTAGNLLFSTGALASTKVPIYIKFAHGIPFNTGLCLSIQTSASNCLIEYE